MPPAFYFGKFLSLGSIELFFDEIVPTERDVIVFGIQTISASAQIFRLESKNPNFFLDFEIVRKLFRFEERNIFFFVLSTFRDARPVLFEIESRRKT